MKRDFAAGKTLLAIEQMEGRACSGSLGHLFPHTTVSGTPCMCGMYETTSSPRGMVLRSK